MALGSRVDGGGKAMSVPIRKTIQYIREIAPNHSDAEIYAALKETNMDPDQTVEKLLNQDPFHEVKRKKDKKKENAGHVTDWAKSQHNGQNIKRNSSISASHSEKTTQRKQLQALSHQNVRVNVRNVLPGVTREFRVVRDNRVNQDVDRDANQKSHHCAASQNGQTNSNISEKRHTEWELPTHGQRAPPGTNNGNATNAGSVSSEQGSERTRATVSNPILHPQNKSVQNSLMHIGSSASSSSGLYSSSSDPVHVPSSDSRSGGTVGAIRREIGPVGVCRPTFDRPTSTSQPSLPYSSLPAQNQMKVVKTNIGSAGHADGLPKNSHSTDTSASIPVIRGASSSRSSFSNQYGNRLHQQTIGHRKVTQFNMEWKPKVSQQSRMSSSEMTDGASAPLSHLDNSIEENVQAVCSSEKQSDEVECVVIPQHLLVPESERGHITFGSFGAVDSTIGNAEDSMKEFTERASTSVFVETSEGTSVGVQVDSSDGRMQTSSLDSTASATTSEQPASENTKSGAHNAVSYSNVGLDKNHSPSYSFEPQQQIENSPRLPKLSEAFESQQNYDASFFKAAMEDSVSQLGVTSQPDVLSSHVGNSGSSNIVTAQHQAFTQQQQVGQLYPQVQLSHFTNYVPYRQLLSPLYVPPMGMPNYSNGTAYAHPPNGSSYLLMPGGNPQLAAAVKYAQSQYKAVAAGNPAGYGNFTNAAGYNISSPGTIGSAGGIDDVARMKYKDNNLYLPNAQVETSDLWMQNQRDSAQYYNLSAQAPHAYLPSNTGHAFSAQAQPSHMQYTGVYHPQPNAIANPHHLVHQHVSPGMGGNVGVNVVAPTPQVGAYQQPQPGHLNWTNNF